MSQSDMLILGMIGVILGEGCFFSLFLSKFVEEWREARRKEVDVILKEAKLVLHIPSVLETFNGLLMDILKKEEEIDVVCNRIERRLSALSADTMWTGGIDSGLSCTPESETSGDSGD